MELPLLGTYWTAADVMIQDIAKKEGGMDKLKGKKIALVYHDSPYGKEPIPLLQKRAAKEGFELLLYPVTAPAWSRSPPGCRSARRVRPMCCCGARAS